MSTANSDLQPDPSTRNVLELMAASGVAPMHELGVTQARENMRAGAVNDTDPVPVSNVLDRAFAGRAGDVPIRCYYPRDVPAEGLPSLLYFHGGGFVIGDLDTHDNICRHLCRHGDVMVISVDYRLAPEHRYPAAVEDALDAFAWLCDNATEIGADAQRIAVGGDSAGGALAAVVAHQARDVGVSLKAQLLLYPVVDLGGGYASEEDFTDMPPISAPVLDWFWHEYFGTPLSSFSDRRHPWVSPIHAARFEDLAPAFVLTAGLDPLRDQGAAYAARLSAAGIETIYQCVFGTIHGFLRLGRLIPTATESLIGAGGYLARRMAV